MKESRRTGPEEGGGVKGSPRGGRGCKRRVEEGWP